MLYLFRHLLSVLLLPAMVLIAIPVWIARRWNVVVTWPHSAVDWVAAVAGVITGIIGLILFSASLRRFASEGRGTLAPWDPPRRLVVRGPYRYVRNPMISGVLFMLAGLALTMRSWPHAMWTVVFAAMNLLYIPLIEEPMLEARFEDDYRAYKRGVPRILPLMRPWRGNSAGGAEAADE
jgi:protein-S-isoprenylcysteine O-methyltransferase Ste14